MGRGDKKSKKGKRFQHSFGKTRPRNKKIVIVPKNKIAEKVKPVESKKLVSPEVTQDQPAQVETEKVD